MEALIGYEASLVGIDKTNTVNAYYQRDVNMNMNNNNNIINNLKKLGYYLININLEEEKYFKSKLISKIKNNPLDVFFQENIHNFISELKNTNDYISFIQRVNHRLERASELYNNCNNNDIYNFYSALTLDELNYLGY